MKVSVVVVVVVVVVVLGNVVVVIVTVAAARKAPRTKQTRASRACRCSHGHAPATTGHV